VLIGWGRANHAGRGAANVRAAILTEDYGTRPPFPAADSVDGNALLYGQETAYSGKNPPTAAAYAASVRVFAAVCDFHGWSGRSCIGHREWTARKPDPGHLDMAQFRADVDALLEAGPEGDDVAFSDDDINKLTNIVRSQTFAAIQDYIERPDKGPTRQIGDGADSVILRMIEKGAANALTAKAVAQESRSLLVTLAGAVAGLGQVDVDEAALAERIVAAMPDSFAQHMADVLAQRLAE
jgi:hypothetical protein